MLFFDLNNSNRKFYVTTANGKLISLAINNSEDKYIILKIKKKVYPCINLKLTWVLLEYTTLKSFPLRLFSWATAQPRLLIAVRPARTVASLMSTAGWEGLEPVALN